MAWFEGTHNETRTLSSDLATALAHIQNVQSVISSTKDIESAEITDGVVHFQMKESDYGVTKFKGDFKCLYEVTDDGLRWSSEDGGNFDQSGSAKLIATADGCELTYTETVKINLDISKLTATMLKPVVGPMMAMEVKDFVKRLVAPIA